MLYDWVHTLLVSGCICALVLYVCPEGKVRSLLETGCACVMLLALISPLSGLNLDAYASALSEYRQQLQAQEQLTMEAAEQLSRQVIEEEYEAYIISEATEQTVEIQSVQVTARQDEDGNWIPYEVVYGSVSEVPASFKAHITTQLGIAEERQSTNEATSETAESVAR